VTGASAAYTLEPTSEDPKNEPTVIARTWIRAFIFIALSSYVIHRGRVSSKRDRHDGTSWFAGDMPMDARREMAGFGQTPCGIRSACVERRAVSARRARHAVTEG
jgi:hypothetical protein